jgi:large subunit ribosomal protein L14
MIQVQSWLETMDNSGARYIECIKTLGGFNRKFSYAGDFILVSIKQLRLVRKVRVGQIYLALITRTKKKVKFLDGTSSHCQNNVALLMNKKKTRYWNKIFRMSFKTFKKKKIFTYYDFMRKTCTLNKI